MNILKETIVEVVEIMRADNKCNQDIENAFKAALKRRIINIDEFYLAMQEIYKD